MIESLPEELSARIDRLGTDLSEAERAAISRRLRHLTDAFPLEPGERVLLPLDLERENGWVWSLWVLSQRAIPVLVPESRAEAARPDGVSVLRCSVAALTQPDGVFNLPEVRLVIFSGELPDERVVRAVAARGAATGFAYCPQPGGPEVTLASCPPTGTPGDWWAARPLVPVRVIDAAGQPAPSMVPGLVELDGTLLPDRARWTRDGRLQFLGAAAGHEWLGARRIDVIAFESRLRTVRGVRNVAVAIPRDELGRRAAVACIEPLSVRVDEELHTAAAGPLAGTGGLAGIVQVSRIPRTASGAVDYEALTAFPVLDRELAVRLTAAVRRALPGGEATVRLYSPQPLATIHEFDILPPSARSSAAAPPPRGAAPILQPDDVPAVASGGPLRMPAGAAANLMQSLERAAADAGNKGVTYVASDGSRTFQTYRELRDEALGRGAFLRDRGFRPRDRALLIFRDLRSYFTTFWACVAAGVVPATVAAPRSFAESEHGPGKIAAAWRLLGRPTVLTDADMLEELGRLAASDAELAGLTAMNARGAAGSLPSPADQIDAGDTLFVQLTSGSTGTPKGIPESHRAILAHLEASAQVNGYTAADVSLNWLPVDHVVPMITFHLRSVYLGASDVQVNTGYVLADPLRWLDLIEELGVTHSWAPNFAFRLVAERLRSGHRRQWNLRRLRRLMNAGEQVTLPAVRDFLEATAPFGIEPSVVQPAFGMAEVSTCMTYHNGFATASAGHWVARESLGARLESAREHEPAVHFVDLGPPMPGVDVRIVSGTGDVLPEGVIGRLQIRGAVVMQGYLGEAGADAGSLHRDGWLDTGDLAFLKDGRLSVTGRAKEQIVVRGANLSCHELEDVAGRTAGARPTLVAACGVPSPTDGEEAIALFFVPAADADGCQDAAGHAGGRSATGDGEREVAAVREIRAALGRELGLNPDFVIAVGEHEFPKTTSGKIQRGVLRTRFAAGDFDGRIQRIDAADGSRRILPELVHRITWSRRDVRRDSRHERRWIIVGEGELAHEVAHDLPGSLVVASASDISGRLQTMSGVSGLLLLDARERSPSTGKFPDVVEPLAHHLPILQTLDGIRAANPRLVWVTRGAVAVTPDEPVDAGRAGAVALLRSAPREWDGLHVRIVDGTALEADRILSELADEGPESVIAWRKGIRWTEELAPGLPPVDASPLLRHGGRWVVTGGLGGVGRTLVRYMRDRWSARLLVLGHRVPSPLPEDPHVRVERIDVTDAAAVRDAIDAWIGRTGSETLDGVFHLAGQYHECAIRDETPGGLTAAMHAKVDGATALLTAIERRPRTALFAFASVNATFGGHRAAAYSAANRALGGVCHEARRAGRPATCVEWTRWQDLGISAEGATAPMSEARGFRTLSPDTALLYMAGLLHRPAGHYIVGLDERSPHVRPLVARPARSLFQLGVWTRGAIEPAVRDSWPPFEDRFGRRIPFSVFESAELPPGDPEACEAGAPDAALALPRTAIERAVYGIWKEVLRIPSFGIHDNFFALGGQSLLGVDVVARIEAQVSAGLSLGDLIQSPTVAALAERIGRLQTGSARSE